MPSEITTPRDAVHIQVDNQWEAFFVIKVGFVGFQPLVQVTLPILESLFTQGLPAYLSSFSISLAQQITGFFLFQES